MDIRLNRSFRRFQRKGDVNALGEAFDLAAPELLRVARHLVPDPAVAEDLVQETFLTAIEKRATFDGSQRALPWLLGILARHAAKARRNAARRPDPERLSAGQEAQDPTESASQKELGGTALGEIDALPTTYAAAVRAFLLDGKAPAEIGRLLGISANAASVRVHRGLKRLQRALPAGAAPAVFVLPKERLAAIRAEVVARGAGAAPVTVSVPALSSLALIGGALMSKPVLLTAAAGVVAAIGVSAFVFDSDVSALGAESRAARPTGDAGVSEVSSAVPATPAKSGRPAREAETTASVAERDPVQQEPVVPDPAATAAEWLARFLQAEEWRESWGIAAELAELPDDEALAILTAIYHDIPDPQHRRQVLKPFVFDGGKPYALDVLHLAATDATLEVQNAGFYYLRDYAFRDFTADYDAYLAWHAEWGSRPLAEVLHGNMSWFVDHIRTVEDGRLPAFAQLIERFDQRTGKSVGFDATEGFADAGLFALVDSWLLGVDPQRQEIALSWLEKLELGEDYQRAMILPILGNATAYGEEVLEAAVDALGREGNEWAVDPLLQAMIDVDDRRDLSRYARALAEIGDARAIPTMIAVIVADDTYDSRYGVGYFGLGKLTGVDYDENHDGQFWLDWWSKNQGRLPEAVQGLPIPAVALK